MSYLVAIAEGAFTVLRDAGPWLLISFVLAGLMREFVRPESLQRQLGTTSLSALAKATVSGMLLPICSCGVIPLGLGLYHSGAYLGPTLSFMAATPIINPAAVLLAYGLLGPQIATIYVVAGFTLPVLVGTIANRLAGPALSRADAIAPVTMLAREVAPLRGRLIDGLRYGFTDLGITVSKFVVIGALFAGVLFAVVPRSFIVGYLGDPGVLSIASIAIVAALMYVCAVGHMPLVAALVAAGASPGVAITFLMVGAATNLPELIAIDRLMGRRAVTLFVVPMVLAGMGLGWLTNALIGEGFTPIFDPSRSEGTIRIAGWLAATIPPPLQWASAFVILAMAVYAYRDVPATLARRFGKVPA